MCHMLGSHNFLKLLLGEDAKEVIQARGKPGGEVNSGLVLPT